MKAIASLFAAALLLTTAGAAPEASSGSSTNSGSTAAGAASNATNEVAVIDTSAGTMVIGFWHDAAPKTVANFKKLARSGFYDGTAFHRIMKGFMIQGGDPLTKDPAREEEWGTGGPSEKTPPETSDRKHVFGVISMARSMNQAEARQRLAQARAAGVPDDRLGPLVKIADDPQAGWSGSQFYICDGTAPHLDGNYTAFGKLIKGDDVLRSIAATPVVPSASGEVSKPAKRVEVKSIKIAPADSIK